MKSSSIKNIKRMWPYIKDSKKYLILYVIVSIIEAIIGAIIPLVSAKVILNITNGIIEELILSALTVFIISLIMHLSSLLKGLFYQKIYKITLMNLQIAVAKETLKLEVKEIDKTSSGVFIDRLNKDTEDISGMFMEYSFYTSRVITNLGVLVTILVLNKYLFMYALLTSIIIFLIYKKRLSKQYEVQREVKKLREKQTGLTSEIVRGIRDIKVLNANETMLNQTTKRIKETTNEAIKMENIRRIYNYIENNTREALDFLFIIYGCILLKANLLTIPAFIIIYNYQSKIQNLLTSLVSLLETNKRVEVSADRIFEVIENKKFKKEKFGKKEIKKLSGNIKFKNVSFGYDEKEIIKEINFEIKPNEKVAFVGKSGEGKTTLFNLITKLYNRNSGEILFDNISIDDLTQDSLRNNMSIITQSPYIFNFSIKDNLLLAKEDATMEEIKEACRLARIDKYIESLPDKYDTMIGENGVILSGGQKQRLAIARALLMKTEIILFDEATSALDNETQREIQESIDNLKGEYTILIIAHRISTIINCDRIILIEDGKIVDEGTHEYLLKNNKNYKKLCQTEITNE